MISGKYLVNKIVFKSIVAIISSYVVGLILAFSGDWKQLEVSYKFNQKIKNFYSYSS